MIGIVAENSKSKVSVLFDDLKIVGAELVRYKKCCCFCHHSKKTGRQIVLHMGIIIYSFVELHFVSSRIWTTTTSTLAAHCTYKTFENNLSQGFKFNPFFSGLWFLQALLVMPASVSQRGCNRERKMRTRL
jgi:hypothetical protein